MQKSSGIEQRKKRKGSTLAQVDPRLERLIRSASPGGICPWCHYPPLGGHDPECDVQLGKVVMREPIDPATLPPLPKQDWGMKHYRKIIDGMKRKKE